MLSGEEPAGPGDCAEADSPRGKRMNAKAKILGRTGGFSLLTRCIILLHGRGRPPRESPGVNVKDMSEAQSNRAGLNGSRWRERPRIHCAGHPARKNCHEFSNSRQTR